jgi:hypothetical protein
MGRKKASYPGMIEVIPGVYMDEGGDDACVYFADSKGEIVMWTYDEVKDDPLAWIASMNACLLAADRGVAAVRERTPGPGSVAKFVQGSATTDGV